MKNETETVLKTNEAGHIHTCIDCKKQFEPYEIDDECTACDDGSYTYYREDYEGGDYVGTCPYCKGKGFFTITKKDRCKTCREKIMMEDEDDDYDYCPSCGRSCNCARG